MSKKFTQSVEATSTCAVVSEALGTQRDARPYHRIGSSLAFMTLILLSACDSQNAVKAYRDHVTYQHS